MPEQPMLTISMIVRNEEKHMVTVIQSLLCQTYSNFILEIVNNGSIDSTGEIADGFAKQDYRVKSIHVEKNDPVIGYKVMDSAQTPYFMFAAGHDFYAPTFVEKCIAMLEADPAVLLAYSRASWFKDDKILGEIPGIFDTRGMDAFSRVMVVSFGLIEAYQFYGIYRLAPLKSLGRYNVIGTDHVLLTELAFLGSFALIDEPLFFLRRAEDWGSTESYRKKHHPHEPDGIAPFLKMARAYMMSVADRTADSLDQTLFKTALFTMSLLRCRNVLEMFGESVQSLFARPGFIELANVMTESVASVERMIHDECEGRNRDHSLLCEKVVPNAKNDLASIDKNLQRSIEATSNHNHGKDSTKATTLNSWNNNTSNLRKGRCVTDSYARGWGLQYGDLRQRVREDKLYQEAMQFVAGRSLMSEDNRMNIFLIMRDYLKQINFGHIVEFGTYKGGNALFMAYVAARLHPGMRVYAFDTYTGMPETDSRIDAHGAGDFADVDLDELRCIAKNSGLENIEFVQGLFEEMAPAVLPHIGEISLVHIDCDIYSAVSYSYDAVKPFMVPGGYLIFDDATYSSCLGATEAVEELAIRRDGLNSEQIFPQFVFRAPDIWRDLETPFGSGQDSQPEYSVPSPCSQQPRIEPMPPIPSKARVKIAGEGVVGHDLTQIQEGSEFENQLYQLVNAIKPKSIIETGTYRGEGTTRIIASAVNDLQLVDTVFYTIECNPDNYSRAVTNLASIRLLPYVTLLKGLSLPRNLLPTPEEIENQFVTNLEFDDIFVDHQEHDRTRLYYNETAFDDIPDDLLGTCLKQFNYSPDLILLDSGGHIGNIEFNYVINLLRSPCVIALDDIYHVKHHKSFLQIQSDDRFELITSSDEKFGFCIAKFTPAAKMPSTFKKKQILWVRPDSIGDNILAMSILPHLRSRRPDTQITVLCQEHIAELYEACPMVDSIITFNRMRAFQDKEYRAAVLKQLQELKADICLNSVYSRESLTDFFAAGSGALERIALHGDCSNISNEELMHNNNFYTSLVQSSGRHKPELERHQDFLYGIGITDAHLEPAIWLRSDDVTFCERLFEEYGLVPEKTIALFVGAQSDVRLYDHYGKALSAACKEHGFSVIALGAEKDFDINQMNLAETGVKTLNLSGKLTLRQSAAIISRCRLAVGAETGLAHIACAVNTPNVILLGGGHFGRFMPYSNLTTIACLPLECFGCNWKCRFERAYCVKDVSPTVLKEAICQSLAGQSSQIRCVAQGPSLWEVPEGGPAIAPVSYFMPAGTEFISVEKK